MSQEVCFLKNVALKSSYNSVRMDQLGSIQPTRIDSHSTRKQLHRCGVLCYCSVRKNKMLNECEAVEVAKSSLRSVKFFTTKCQILLPNPCLTCVENFFVGIL